MEEEICCKEFNPEPYDNRILEWNEKRFVRQKVKTLFYMPLNYGKKITELQKQIEIYGGTSEDYMCLSDHTSMWNMDIYLAVDQEIPNLDNRVLTGKYYSKVYEGPYKDTSLWMKDFKDTLKQLNYESNDLYMWYTTCPKCAKKYGKNYTVILTRI